MQNQDELVAKLTKEKKAQEEVNRKVGDDLQGTTDKLNFLNKAKTKLEQTLDEVCRLLACIYTYRSSLSI